MHQERVRSFTDQPSAGGPVTTKTHHYDTDGDSPSWTDEGAGAWIRSVAGVDGGLSVTRTSAGATTVHLASLHGDLIADTAADYTTNPGLQITLDASEYGIPRDTTTVGTRRYSWLGTYQRATDTPTGITLMGVRLYNPTTGRFLSTDPVYAGSANDYDYCAADPLNCSDLDGRAAIPHGGGGGSGAGGAGAVGGKVKYGPPTRGNASTTNRHGNNYRGTTWGYTIDYWDGSRWRMYKFGITTRPPWTERARTSTNRCKILQKRRCQYRKNRLTFTNKHSASVWEYNSCMRYYSNNNRRFPPGMRKGCR
ncbi:MAG: hypothetical protein H7Y15_16175 [Pseudonocardia sp.]|nr:hypothetical protein [Pseudonocardia sp.]